ncbi:hypothetical protein IG631_17564 [Alternaria alternata]|nr:hypothetical protein IG631_17564 [Alternaria alternata]
MVDSSLRLVQLCIPIPLWPSHRCTLLTEDRCRSTRQPYSPFGQGQSLRARAGAWEATKTVDFAKAHRTTRIESPVSSGDKTPHRDRRQGTCQQHCY